MTIAFKNALAELWPEEVDFILSQLPPVEAPGKADNESSADTADVLTDGFEVDPDAENHRRRRIEREWPDAGAILRAEYYGTVYTAEVVLAAKKLKSGKQIRLTAGPAQGVVCDSFSEAMIAATEQQRADQNLGRKGVSNGWLFWIWDGKPENIAGDSTNEADEE